MIEQRAAAVKAAESYDRQCREYYKQIMGERNRPLTAIERRFVGAHASVVRSRVIRDWMVTECEFIHALSDLRLRRRCVGSGI